MRKFPLPQAWLFALASLQCPQAARRTDFIQFQVEDLSGNKLFETPDLGKPGFWDGTATQALVAPGAMLIGQTNRVTLTFQKAIPVDQNSLPGRLGRSRLRCPNQFFSGHDQGRGAGCENLCGAERDKTVTQDLWSCHYSLLN